jgi:predicted nucleotidyltransferase
MDLNLTQNELDIIISHIKSQIDIKAIYIFGSYAKGFANSSSDIDIAYLSNFKIDNITRWDLAQSIAIELKRDIDLVDLLQANTILKYQIISEGVRIFGGGDEIEEFESLVYSQYVRFQEERADILQNKLKSFKGK